MKKGLSILIVILGISLNYGQENSGDNFSLEGALEMFKKANSLEEFEKFINTEENNINNLDLNDDGEIDYITVESLKEENTHVIILSTYLDEETIQDIATIGIELTDKEFAVLQIEGNEDLYSLNTIIEPFDIEEESDTSKRGPNSYEVLPVKVIVNVWFWPCVKFIYHPKYVVWKSPYRWKKHPNYWKPWKPYKHINFKSKCVRHNTHYHKTKTHRIVAAKKVYKSRKKATIIQKNKAKKTKTIRNRKR